LHLVHLSWDVHQQVQQRETQCVVAGWLPCAATLAGVLSDGWEALWGFLSSAYTFWSNGSGSLELVEVFL